MAEARFTLQRGQWYGLTMFPGYADAPYHSPIRVDAVTPLGNRCFELRFLNLPYAAGVRDFGMRLRTLRRARNHIIAEDTEGGDRTYVVCALTPGWMRQHFANIEPRNPLFDECGRPVGEAFLKLA